MEGNTLIFIIGGVAILLLLGAYVFIGRARKGTYRGAIEELEIRKYEISNKPVMFELAKLKSVRKSEHIIGLVAQWEAKWKDLEEQLATTEDNIAYAEENIAAREYDRADEIIEATGKDLTDLMTKVDALLAEIDNLKTSESRNRDGIEVIRETFDELNVRYSKEKAVYTEISDALEGVFTEAKDLFDEFAAHMETSNYDLADEVSEKIKVKLALIKKIMDKVPLYRESVDVDILPMLDGILESHTSMTESGVSLKHLDVEVEVGKLKKTLETVDTLLMTFDFEKIEALLVDVPQQAKTLRAGMKQEVDMKDAFESDVAQLKKDAAYVIKECQSLNDRYDKIKDHCLMRTDDEANFKDLTREINILEAGVKSLYEDLDSGEKAISETHGAVLNYLNQLGEITEQLRIFDEELMTLQQGQTDVRGESLERLKELNELKADFERIQLDKNVQSFRVTLEKAEHHINELLEESSVTPMDVAKVKLNLDVATEMVNKAKKEITLTFEQLKLAERLLVYGNRYIEREGMYLMDLTIAEDQFHQGNYQTVIDKMYKILSDVEGSTFFKVFEHLKQEIGCVVL